MSGPKRSLVVARRALDEDLNIQRAAFSPDGSLLVLDTRSQALQRLAFMVPNLRPARPPRDDSGCGFDRPEIRALRADGKLFLVPRAPGSNELHSFRLLNGYVHKQVDATPDLRLAAALCDWHGRYPPAAAVWLVRIPDGTPRAPLVIESQRPHLLALHPAGTLVALITADAIALLDAGAVLQAEAIHERALDALPRHSLAELHAARAAGMGYGDFFRLHSSSHVSICQLEEQPVGSGGRPQSPEDLRAQFLAAARRGTGLSLPMALFRKSGRLWPDVLTGSGHQLVSERAVRVFAARGFTGWRARPQPLAEPKAPLEYLRIEAEAPPLPRLLESQFADPEEYSALRPLFKLDAWKGEDFLAIEGCGLVVTRRVIAAMQEADLRGWTARDVLRDGLEAGGRIEGALPSAESLRTAGSAPRAASKPWRLEHPDLEPPWSAALMTAAARRAGLERLEHEIAAAVRPAWHLRTRPVSQAEIPLGGSCLGGLPDLPRGSTWPRREHGPLSFLGQLQVADIAALDEEHLLPAAGHFSFFLDEDDNDDGAAHVLFTAAGAPLERLDLPGGELRRYLPCALEMDAIASLPGSDSPVVAAWNLNAAEEDAYHDLSLSGFDSDRCHQVFGYPASIQYDVFSSASSEGERWPVADSRLLLQLDDDDDLGTEWGDCGHVYFVIPAAALRALKLDRTVFVFDCQ